MQKQWAVFFMIVTMAFWGQASAQMVIRVDSSLSRNVDKSLLTAVGMSAILPGTGQIYLEEKEWVKTYVWSDVALWSTLALAWFVQQQTLSTAQSYASRYAGIKDPPRNAKFLDIVARYRSRAGVAGQNSNPDLDEDYNQALLRSGKKVDDYYPMTDQYTWDWGNSENVSTTQHMEELSNILDHYRMSRIALQVSIGALILNRLVSIFDVLHIYRATSNASLSWNVMPVWTPERSGAQVQVGF